MTMNVLPCDGNGLPIVDSFIATSFSAIEEMFKNNVYIAKLCHYLCLPFIILALEQTINSMQMMSTKDKNMYIWSARNVQLQ